MKKTILWISLLLLCNNVYADSQDVLLKKQCQYTVHGTGSNNIAVENWIIGVAIGTLYNTETKNRTERAKKKKSIMNLVNLACKETLMDNESYHPFKNKMLWALAKLINKNHEPHLLIKSE